MGYILSLHIGTSNVTVIILDEKGHLVGIEKELISFSHPFHGYVESNPEEIFSRCLSAIKRVISNTGIRIGQISGLGISNAPSSTILWDKQTKKPLWNMISWNDGRGKRFCNNHKLDQNHIKEKTGRFLSTYTSVSKIRWIIDHNNIKNLDDCLFGTLNTWILWRLTNGTVHEIDMTNACNTLLFNLHTRKWDEELIELFRINKRILPKVKSCSEIYGYVDEKYFGAKIPICSMIDAPAGALFASGCHNEGDIHCSFGSGSFITMNTGEKINTKNNELASTMTMSIRNKSPTYCLLGSVYSTGSVVEWLRLYLGIIKSNQEIEGLAYSVPDSGGVYFVPTLGGRCYPYEDESIRGALFGISNNTNIGHIARATLEGIALIISDVYKLISQSYPHVIKKVKCSGGMTEDVFLLQMTSNLMGIEVLRSKKMELSAYGAAYLAGLELGFWNSEEEISALWESDRTFIPTMSAEDIINMKKNWKRAVSASALFNNIKIA